jgi:hypothetical protein
MPSMIVKQKSPLKLKNVFLSAVMLLVLFNCSDDEIIAPKADATAAAPVTEEITDATEQPLAFSLTISGAHTTFSKANNCSSCTFVVPANTFIIDGKEKGFKPGDVICLDAAIKYGSLEFVNMEGSADKPIIISNCGGSDVPATEAAATSEEESY